MPEAHAVLLIAQRELTDAWRNRWFVLFSAMFAAVALAVAWISVAGLLGAEAASLGRTSVSLVNLVVLIVPLMGLTLGAASIAGERERGSLLSLAAQPVRPLEIVLGKFVGLSTAVVASLAFGFGLAAAVLARRGGGSVSGFLTFLGLAAMVGVATVAVGLLISALARRSASASGVALFVWLVFVFLGDLGLMGTSLVLQLDGTTLLAAALANPLQVFKIAALESIHGGLDALGPAGLYAQHRWGTALLPALVGLLAAWIAVPTAAAAWTLERRGCLT